MNRHLRHLLLFKRWPWHLLFWIGYGLFRFWLYYITVKYYPRIYLEYMLLSELPLVVLTYLTLWLYKRLFERKHFLLYFMVGTFSWLLLLYGRTVFQVYYLKGAPGFNVNGFADIFLNNIAVVIVYFLFITSCKYFKDGYIKQQFETERKEQQLMAEIKDLKSQVAPHFLFNTLNNLYGLAVDKSDKLPDLMLRLSNLLRHSLYESQKPVVPLSDEIKVLKSYIELESLRLEDDLKLIFNNRVPDDTAYGIAPLILIVFIENAFKHSRFVQSTAVKIDIKTALQNDWLDFAITNNYNNEAVSSATGIGLTNVKRRLEVLYPGDKHQLTLIKDEQYFTVYLHLQLASINKSNERH